MIINQQGNESLTLNSKHIWLLQDGEPLPIDQKPRLMRTGNLAQKLTEAGFSVTWWASRFNHSLKRYREFPDTFCKLDDRYRIYLLDGPRYKKNVSFARIRHYRSLAANFTKLADSLERPDIILASYPSPELCFAGMQFAKKNSIPFIIDIRDPWPGIFPEYFPPFMRCCLFPVICYYRRKIRLILHFASSILAVSEAMLNWGIQYSGRLKSKRDKVFYIGYNQRAVEREITVPEYFTEENPLICLFATTCGNSYDGFTLVEAARILESRGERRVCFIVSGDGEFRPKWIAQASGLKTVQFTGWVSDEELQAYFLEAHVGLILMRGGITSFWLGNKFSEYLSTFLTLVNNVPGEPAEIVNNHKLGLNVSAKNPQALADAISTLLNSPEMVKEFMKNSNKVFHEIFERGKIYDGYVKYLIDCLNRDGAS
jgi:glycosyltransferase involved in cell wall biosynthesis